MREEPNVRKKLSEAGARSPRARFGEAERLLQQAQSRLNDMQAALSDGPAEAAKEALSLVGRAREIVQEALARHR